MCALTVFDAFGLWWCFESKWDDGFSRLFFAFYKHGIWSFFDTLFCWWLSDHEHNRIWMLKEVNSVFFFKYADFIEVWHSVFLYCSLDGLDEWLQKMRYNFFLFCFVTFVYMLILKNDWLSVFIVKKNNKWWGESFALIVMMAPEVMYIRHLLLRQKLTRIKSSGYMISQWFC